MKCQNCGINFDDDDRECPICGARAGSRGRLSVPRYTDDKHKTHSDKTCTHKSFTTQTSTVRPYTTQQQTNQPATPKKTAPRDKSKLGLILALIVVVLNVLPAVLGTIIETAQDAIAAVFPDDSSYIEDYGFNSSSDAYYDDNYAEMYTFIGTESVGTLPNGGTVSLMSEPGEWGEYTLRIETAAGVYTEDGESWCNSIPPEENYLEDEYPSDQYDLYVLSLQPFNTSFDPLDGQIPEPISQHMDESSDLWLYAYVERADGTITLTDMDECGLFDGQTTVTLHQTEAA